MGMVYDFPVSLMRKEKDFKKLLIGRKCVAVSVLDDADEQRFFFDNGMVLVFSVQSHDIASSGSGYIELRKTYIDELKEAEK